MEKKSMHRRHFLEVFRWLWQAGTFCWPQEPGARRLLILGHVR